MDRAAESYAVLGLDAGASPSELDRAYRRRARAVHPDHCPGDPGAAARFAELTAAYEFLKSRPPAAMRARVGPPPPRQEPAAAPPGSSLRAWPRRPPAPLRAGPARFVPHTDQSRGDQRPSAEPEDRR